MPLIDSLRKNEMRIDNLDLSYTDSNHQQIIENMNRGSEWRIWDLHFHTPSSYDYKDNSVTNEDIVQGLAAAGVSVVAITDHYVMDVSRIRELQYLGQSHHLSVLPGIEFCSELGGSEAVHFIGIFPETADLESIWTKIQGQCNLTRADIDDRGGYERVCCEFVKTCNLILSLGGLVTVHAGKKSNTLEGIRNNLLVKQELKQDLLSRFRPLLDVGKPEDVDGYRKYVFPDIGFSLPVIMCSDNHNIHEYTVKEKMWIKANPTFEGLKQILYEPDERVRIQTTKPDEKNIYHVIDSIKLNEEGFWNDTLFLNPNLNTIIGGRSTGKSSLLKAIAAKHGSKDIEADDYIRDHLDGVTIQWQDGTDQIGREIDYFKQNYMHDIASEDRRLNELVEEVIRNKDKSSLLGKYYDTIKELTKSITHGVFMLFQTHKDFVEKSNELKTFGKKEGVQQQIALLKEKIVELQKGSEITHEDQLVFESQAAKIKENLKNVECADHDLIVLEKLLILTPFNNKFEEQNQTNTLSFGLNLSEFAREFKNLKINTEQQFCNLVRKYIESTQTTKDKLLAQCKEIAESATYQKGLAYIEGNKELKDITAKVAEEEKKLSIIEACQLQLDALKLKIKDYFNEVVEKHCVMKATAEDVVKNLNISYDGLTIDVILNHHREKLQQFLEARLNLRGYERQEYLAKFIKYYDSDNKQYIRDILKQLLNEQIQLKNSNTSLNVATELLSQNWYSLNYELSYQGDLFRQMSEGKQAFVVLKLLLEFSDKKCPILIDQPEDSLDNRAIYNELVKYIKTKKTERQIILVTHNSNVVVSADAENVIVANQDGNDSHNRDGIRFQYVNGALEFTKPKDPSENIVLYAQGIREHVCDILEGGKDAFVKREQKYGFR